MEYGYTRTSADADGQGQRHRLLAAGIPEERIYHDQGISGMVASRPEFDRVLALLKAGDVLVTPELSRIGRSVRNVLAVIDDLEARSVGLRILDLALDTTTPVGRMVLTVLSAISRLERDMISQRTKAALDARKASGVKLGSPPKVTAKDEASIAAMRSAGMKPENIGKILGLSRATVYRCIKRAADSEAESNAESL